MTPKCPTFHQQRTRSADASNIADVKTSIKRRQSDGHPLITMLRGVHGQTGNNMREQSYFGGAGLRRHVREACGRRARKPRLHAGRFRDQVRVFPGYTLLFFSGYTPLFAARPGVKLPFVSFAARVCCKFAAWMCCKETTNKTKQQ